MTHIKCIFLCTCSNTNWLIVIHSHSRGMQFYLSYSYYNPIHKKNINHKLLNPTTSKWIYRRLIMPQIINLKKSDRAAIALQLHKKRNRNSLSNIRTMPMYLCTHSHNIYLYYIMSIFSHDLWKFEFFVLLLY